MARLRPLTLNDRGPFGQGAEEILYRSDEPRLELVEKGRPWTSQSPGNAPRL